DEFDSKGKDNEDIRNVVNSGSTRASTARVIRCNPNTLEPESFSTFCPKVIGLIGKLHGTTQDRSIEIVIFIPCDRAKKGGRQVNTEAAKTMAGLPAHRLGERVGRALRAGWHRKSSAFARNCSRRPSVRSLSKATISLRSEGRPLGSSN